MCTYVPTSWSSLQPWEESGIKMCALSGFSSANLGVKLRVGTFIVELNSWSEDLFFLLGGAVKAISMKIQPTISRKYRPKWEKKGQMSSLECVYERDSNHVPIFQINNRQAGSRIQDFVYFIAISGLCFFHRSIWTLYRGSCARDVFW